MKKHTSALVLRLHRETLRSLQEPELSAVAGAVTDWDYCTSVGPGCSDYTVGCTQETCAATQGPGCYSRDTCGTNFC